MSNQIGLMLSSLFLVIFLIFSGEIISCQTVTAKAMAQTEQFGLYVQRNGYDLEELVQMNKDKYFKKINVLVSRDRTTNMYYYTISTYKDYHSFSKIFSFMDRTITCKVTVCLKQQ